MNRLEATHRTDRPLIIDPLRIQLLLDIRNSGLFFRLRQPLHPGILARRRAETLSIDDMRDQVNPLARWWHHRTLLRSL
ncbi:hypothetical protein N8343_05600 [Akkermansiaceae bacterium]|nr:hypothetical protein [Akkermansiaceae bacterium]MDC1405118.1 hypothetical protein [Akkermansiaceae bacterium]